MMSPELFSGRHAHFGMRAGAKALRDADTQLDAGVCARELKLLRVGVRNHELHAFEPGFDHVVNGVASGTTDTKHDNARFQFRCAWRRKMNSHGFGPTFHNLSLRGCVERFGPQCQDP
ncbi:hypothetical protein MMA231_00857 [Asticcacaulis sp. MM231]